MHGLTIYKNTFRQSNSIPKALLAITSNIFVHILVIPKSQPSLAVAKKR